jgi:hypothetical protein
MLKGQTYYVTEKPNIEMKVLLYTTLHQGQTKVFNEEKK